MERIPKSVVRINGDAATVGRDRLTIPRFETVCNYAEEAIHNGIESARVSVYLRQLGFDVEGYNPITRQIGGQEYVSPKKARELRLLYANRLKEDVRNLLERNQRQPCT